MGITWEKYVPAEPPCEGRYAVRRRSDGENPQAWQPAYIDGDGQWKYPDSSGDIHDVTWFLDIGGLNT